MLKLVAKDFRITRLFWLPAVFSYLTFLLMSYESVSITLFTGIVLALVLPGLILLIEDRHGTDALHGALPATRRDIVLARFLTAGTVMVICLVLFYLGTAGIIGLFDEKASHLRPLLTPRAGLVFVSTIGLLMSLFLPIFFRCGLGKAVFRLIIVLLGGSIALMGLLRLLEPGLLAFVNRGRDAGEATVGSGPALILRLLSKIESSLGAPMFAALVLIVTAFAVFASIRLSIRFYRRRDL